MIVASSCEGDALSKGQVGTLTSSPSTAFVSQHANLTH